MPSPRSRSSTTISILRRSKTATLSLRACLALGGVFCFMVFQLIEFNSNNDITKETTTSSLLLYASHHHNSSADNNDNKEPEQDGSNSNNRTSSFLLETFALSFDPTNVEKLQERNKHSNLGPVLWVHGTDGMQQRTLDLWAKLTNHGHAGMTVEQAAQLPKTSYESPHAVGCYLAHWNLLRTLAHRPKELLQLQQYSPDKNKHAYLILEDDAACAPGLDQEIERTIQQLPSDWDILFVGGKPFSYFDNSNPGSNNDVNDANNNNNNNNDTALKSVGKLLIQEYMQQDAATGNFTAMKQRIRHAICQGAFGPANGPLAPDGSRRLSQDHQAYWRLDYLTNTHSYVVNPQRVGHVAKLLHPTMDVPVDIRLADLMKLHQLNAFMTTRMWCDQSISGQPLMAPQTWQGFFVIDWNYLWQTQMHLDEKEDCAF